MNICTAPSILTSDPARDPCDRSSRARVREERLRATMGLEGSLSLSSWRGRSGRRYVVGIHGFAELGVEDLVGAVLIAVRRDGHGIARVVDVACGETGRDEAERGAWLDAMSLRGAQEVHIHLLAGDEAARNEIAEDLRDGDLREGNLRNL